MGELLWASNPKGFSTGPSQTTSIYLIRQTYLALFANHHSIDWLRVVPTAAN